MSPNAVISGLGLVTPLGRDVSETWESLLRGDFIRDHERVPDEIFGSLHEPRVNRLAKLAAAQAVKSANWTADDLADSETALIVGTSKGPIESWIAAPPHMAKSACEQAGRSLSAGLADTANGVAEHVKLGDGPRMTISAACASGIHALIRATMMIRSGEIRRAIVVAAEASVHPLFLGSFKRLGVLPADNVGCRPFDQTRDGFLMSESAAAVCLESSESNPSRTIVTIDRFAMGGDATHITGGDPSGETLRHLLGNTVQKNPIDLIHAHATGTTVNDPVELEAIEVTSGPICDRPATSDNPCYVKFDPPSVYSHKGALGHSLGAAGLVSVVLNCLMHQYGIVLPNVQTRTPLPTRNVTISREAVRRKINRSIAIASGFGGAIGVVSLVSTDRG